MKMWTSLVALACGGALLSTYMLMQHMYNDEGPPSTVDFVKFTKLPGSEFEQVDVFDNTVVDKAVVAFSLQDDKLMDELKGALIRAVAGRKVLNRPRTVARTLVRVRTNGGEFYALATQLIKDGELTLDLRVGAEGNPYIGLGVDYYLEGEDAKVWVASLRGNE